MIDRAPAILPLLKWARKKIHLEELRRITRHSSTLDQSYEISMKNLDFLLEQGLVQIVDDRLVIGELTRQEWITDGLMEADPVAWEIVDSFQGQELKFDPDSEVLASIGLRGELFVLDALQQRMQESHFSKVRHVSKFDDTAGYDIQTPLDPSGTTCYLEVKSTTRPQGAFTFYLSRNEWVQSMRLSHWYLVLVRLTPEGGKIFGHLDSRSLATYMPSNQHRDFQWQSTIGKLSKDDVYSGLPIKF